MYDMIKTLKKGRRQADRPARKKEVSFL